MLPLWDFCHDCPFLRQVNSRREGARSQRRCGESPRAKFVSVIGRPQETVKQCTMWCLVTIRHDIWLILSMLQGSILLFKGVHARMTASSFATERASPGGSRTIDLGSELHVHQQSMSFSTSGAKAHAFWSSRPTASCSSDCSQTLSNFGSIPYGSLSSPSNASCKNSSVSKWRHGTFLSTSHACLAERA